MTKSYQIKTYLIDCVGYSDEDLKGANTDELVELVENEKECAEYLEVPMSYLK